MSTKVTDRDNELSRKDGVSVGRKASKKPPGKGSLWFLKDEHGSRKEEQEKHSELGLFALPFEKPNNPTEEGYIEVRTHESRKNASLLGPPLGSIGKFLNSRSSILT